MNYSEALETVFSLPRSRGTPTLEGLKNALKEINFEKSFKIIQLVGTNGKGSVGAFLNQAFVLSNKKVGWTVSPHLHKVNERFQVNGQQISDEEFVSLVKEFLFLQKKFSLTFFEFMFLLIAIYFERNGIEVAIFESGMGSEWDASSAFNHDALVITNVGLDHEKFLGETLEKIAETKANTIQENDFVVSSVLSPAKEVVERIAKQRNAELVFAEPYLNSISLVGDFQKKNAGCAREILLHFNVPEQIISDAFASTVWPGRLEEINSVLFDCAHNPHAVKALVENLSQKFVVVFAAKNDKHAKEMIELLSPVTQELVFTRFPFPPQCVEPFTGTIIEGPFEALDYARNKGRVLVCGSIFLVSVLRNKLLND